MKTLSRLVLPAALMISATAILAGCSPANTPAQVSASDASESAAMSLTAAEAASIAASVAASEGSASLSTSAATNDFTGKWTGPEGTSLTITPQGSQYEVVITNLDGPRTFTGSLEADGLHIVRDTLPLVIRKGDGKATGMKWLADKHDCLVVMANEGYCRD